jgi:hypothetical protein
MKEKREKGITCRKVTTTEKVKTEIGGNKFILEAIIERTRHSRRQNAWKTPQNIKMANRPFENVENFEIFWKESNKSNIGS